MCADARPRTTARQNAMLHSHVEREGLLMGEVEQDAAVQWAVCRPDSLQPFAVEELKPHPATRPGSVGPASVRPLQRMQQPAEQRPAWRIR